MLIRKLFFLFLLALSLSATASETIDLTTQNGKIATAEFTQGEPEAAVILILHGFLQTRDFSTVSRLASALSESGHTILMPTLTLGLNRRKKSLACEAIHLHNVDMDTSEIHQWIDWLHHKTGKKITLIGHSAGSQTMLNYLQTRNTDKIDKAIFISLSYFAEGPYKQATESQARKAQQLIREGQNPLGTYSLSFCKTYPTTARNFMSYYQWDREKVIKTTKNYSDLITIIIGTGDHRIDLNWRKQLIDAGIKVSLVDGANHFFDQAHEFDLLDSVESELEKD